MAGLGSLRTLELQAPSRTMWCPCCAVWMAVWWRLRMQPVGAFSTLLQISGTQTCRWSAKVSVLTTSINIVLPKFSLTFTWNNWSLLWSCCFKLVVCNVLNAPLCVHVSVWELPASLRTCFLSVCHLVAWRGRRVPTGMAFLLARQ